MYQKMSKNIKNRPQMGTHVRTIFCHPASFLLSQAPLGANMAPKAPPGPVQASIFTDFGSILVRFADDFSCHMSYFLLVCLDSFLLTSNHIFQNSLYKFKLFWVVNRVIGELRSALHGTVAGRPKASGYVFF